MKQYLEKSGIYVNKGRTDSELNTSFYAGSFGG